VAPSDSSSEDEGGFEDEPGASHLQPDRPTSRGHVPSSSFTSIASDEEDIFQNGTGQQVQTPSTSQWTQPSGPQRNVVHAFRRGPRVAKRQRSATYKITAPVHLAFSCCIFLNYHTAGDGVYEIEAS